jgi:O-antigen ligase
MAISSFSPNKALKQFGYSKVIHGSFDSAISGYRKDRVSMAINMTKDHPFVGVGLKHFRLLFNKYSKYKDGSIEPYELMIPDNMYLSFLSESGILGLLGFLALVFSLLRRGIRRYDQEANDRIRLTILIPWCALVGLSVSMGSYDLFYWPNPATLFALTCGFIQSS